MESAKHTKSNEEKGSQFHLVTGAGNNGEMTYVIDEGTKKEQTIVLTKLHDHPTPTKKGQQILLISASTGGPKKPNVSLLILKRWGSTMKKSKSQKSKSENTTASTYLHTRLTSRMGLESMELGGKSLNTLGNEGVDGYEYLSRAYTSPFLTSDMIANMPKTQICVHGSAACKCRKQKSGSVKSSKNTTDENDENEESGSGGEEVGVNMEEAHLKNDE